MIDGLISLLILAVVVGIVVFVVQYLVDLLPMQGNFKQMVKVLVLLVGVLIVLKQALGLLGIAVV